MSTRSRVVCLVGIVVGTLCLNAYAQDEEPAAPPARSKKSAKAEKAEPLLPRTLLLPLKPVKDAFPELTRQASTGPDSSALGTPRLTREVVYASSDGAKQLTLTVDEYEYESQALLAYQQANQKTLITEFEPIAISNVGQQVFAGAMKQGSETQIVVVTVNNRLLVGARLAGYDDTTDNISKLVELARLQESESHTRVSAARKR
jgi:hypothetical protein